MAKKTSILLIYTGGTIGMVQDHKTGALVPFNFKHLTLQVPELQEFDLQMKSVSFNPPIDSSNMNPGVWVKLAKIIEENYNQVDGFVILHGSDTMAFTASALSFMLDGLNKPVILTGSQLPIGMIRTDGKENLITAIEIAAAHVNKKPVVPEVAIYFEYQLFRGNRTHKFNAEHFDAFQSPNYPVLAEAGVSINYNLTAIAKHKKQKQKLNVKTSLNPNIAILKIFPGITEPVVRAILAVPHLKGVILESFGAGNAPTDTWFINLLKETIKKGIIIYNVTQCNAGAVQQGRYETSSLLKQIGVLSGSDITLEAAVCKLMYVFGQGYTYGNAKKQLEKSLRGELSQK